MSAVERHDPHALVDPPDPPPQVELFEPEHEGLHPDRLDRMPEAVYAEEWKRHNREHGTLGHVLQARGAMYRHPTRGEAITAACVVQWLGTNVGMGFVHLCEARIAKLQDAAMQLDSAWWRWTRRDVLQDPPKPREDALLAEVVAIKVRRMHQPLLIAKWIEAALEGVRHDVESRISHDLNALREQNKALNVEASVNYARGFQAGVKAGIRQEQDGRRIRTGPGWEGRGIAIRTEEP